MYNLNEVLSSTAIAVDEIISAIIGNRYDIACPVLVESMRYSSLGAGKKVRAFLVINSAAMFGFTEKASVYAASAIEMVHSYSLIHDDLPCMDNSDIRRGKDSCHKRYGKATALLAGNALLTLAFEVLSTEEVSKDPAIRMYLIKTLARSIGFCGMLSGQAMDILSADQNLTFQEILKLQEMKTGKLFMASCEFGAILAKAPETLVQKVREYAKFIGLAFQIKDDLLDISGSRHSIGKEVNKDIELNKVTSVSYLGEDGATKYLIELKEKAVESLSDFGNSALPLIYLANFIASRES